MENQKLLDYIKQQLQQGVDRETIKNSLTSQGWQEQNINTVFQAITSISTPLPKKKKWKKIVLIIVGIIVFLIVTIIFLPSFLGYFAKDIPPIDDSDLQFKNISVLDSENAYFDLKNLESVIYEPEEKSSVILDMITDKTWDNSLAEEVINRNSAAFECFSKAARKAKFQDPAFADPLKISIDTDLPPMDSWRYMAKLSAVRALYLAKQGKDIEAIEEALNSVRIGQKIQDSQAPLIEYMVAIAMKSVGLETLQKIVTTSKLDSETLKHYADELNQFYKNEDGLIMAFKSEYQIQSKVIDLIVKEDANESESAEINEAFREYPVDRFKTKNFFYFQPNKTKAVFAKYARTNIKNLNKSCGNIKTTNAQKLAPSLLKFYITENAIGKMLYDVVTVNLTPVITKKCEEDLLVAATQTILGIKAYKNDNGNYPSSLNDLIPHYLSDVPVDPFDGKALKYSSMNKVIYSVGKDLQDSGGSTGNDWRKMPDPTFKIDF